MNRCPVTGKMSYRSKAKAERAMVTLENKRQGNFESAHAYRCERTSHWHIGNADRSLGPHGAPDPGTTGRGGEKRRATRWNAQEWDAATMTLWARCRDLCEYAHCGRPLAGEMVRHHRQRRAIGGDRLSNLVGLHAACHREVHKNPTESMRLGIIVSSYAPDPARVPLQLPGGRLVMLDDDGGLITTTAP